MTSNHHADAEAGHSLDNDHDEELDEGPFFEPDLVVWCPAHGHYLQHVSGGGTTWALNRDDAKLYHAHEVDEVIRRATWLEHNPEAIPASEAPR